MHFIYIIENKIDGKAYVGQTIDLADRWSLHLSKNSNCRYLHRALEKYGSENFEMSIVEIIEDQNTANEKEKYWIAELKTLSPNGYNLKAGGEQGGSPSEETRKVMSAAAKNRRRGFDATWRENMSNAQTGRKHPEEVKRKISQSHLGIGHTEETKAHLRAINRGKVLSEETREKISSSLRASNAGKPHFNLGRPRTPEQRAKQSEISKKMWERRKNGFGDV